MGSLLGHYDVHDPVYRLETGAIAPDEFCRLVLPGVSADRVRAAWCRMLVGIPLRRLQALEHLSRRYNLYLLSNTNDIHWTYSLEEHFLKQGFDPSKLFKRIFLSHEMHLAKPDEAIYRQVLEEAQLNPEETLFVDDSAENCASFASLGVHTLRPSVPDAWLGELCPAVATVGFFDGVHLGHQHLIGQLKDQCQSGMRSMVVTMNRHPRQIVQPDFAPCLLSTMDVKLRQLRQAGVDHVEVLDFDRAMSRMTAPEFMEHILRDRLGVRILLMGYDHRFGHGGGSHENYVRWGEALGIRVLLATELERMHVSSSEVRHALERGDVATASQLLGRPYELDGRVVSGHQVGRTIGFPTANLEVDPCILIPAGGVYAVWATLPGGERFKGMLNIGQRPTLANGSNVSVEVNLLDFSGDLYDTSLSLQLMQRLRDERRFGSLEELQEQLCQDAQHAAQLLG